MAIPRRPFGKNGETVSALGWGGWHVGLPPEDEAIRLLHQAWDAGITFSDNAWEYNDGISEFRMGKAIASYSGKRDDLFIMTKDCAHDRVGLNSSLKLVQSLKRLQVDYLDLWQIHEVVWEDDPDRIFAPGGSAEALLKAKESGKVRHIGFTGHKSPSIFKRMLNQGFPWDSVMMPLNVLDAHYDSFEKEIIPICQEQGISIIGMKSFADAHFFKANTGISPQEALRYVLSLPISTLVSGIDSQKVYEQNLGVINDFKPLTDEERADILRRSATAGQTGEFEPFKTSRNYEGNEGRVAHRVKELLLPKKA